MDDLEKEVESCLADNCMVEINECTSAIKTCNTSIRECTLAIRALTFSLKSLQKPISLSHEEIDCGESKYA